MQNEDPKQADGLFDLLRRSLRIAILENPLATWDQELTRSLFCKIVALKRSGYGSEHNEGVMPLDASDFFGTHLMVCKESSSGELVPIIAYKSVTLERCDHYRMTFPALTVLQTSRSDASRLLELMERSRKEGFGLSYDSSWTMDVDTRKDRANSASYRSLVTTIGVTYHLQKGLDQWLAAGIKRFKTDAYFSWMGGVPIGSEFKFFGLYDDPAAMIHVPHTSEAALKVAEANADLWERRLVISG